MLRFGITARPMNGGVTPAAASLLCPEAIAWAVCKPPAGRNELTAWEIAYEKQS